MRLTNLNVRVYFMCSILFLNAFFHENEREKNFAEKLNILVSSRSQKSNLI